MKNASALFFLVENDLLSHFPKSVLVHAAGGKGKDRSTARLHAARSDV